MKPPFIKAGDKIQWTLELESKFKQDKIKLHKENEGYLRQHPELKQLLHFVTTQVLMHKPNNVLEFMTNLFKNGPNAVIGKETPKNTTVKAEPIDIVNYVSTNDGIRGSIPCLNEFLMFNDMNDGPVDPNNDSFRSENSLHSDDGGHEEDENGHRQEQQQVSTYQDNFGETINNESDEQNNNINASTTELANGSQNLNGDDKKQAEDEVANSDINDEDQEQENEDQNKPQDEESFSQSAEEEETVEEDQQESDE